MNVVILSINLLKTILTFFILLSFSTSLVFSTLHHAVEEHHHKNEECSAAERGETHLHGWEFENCELCDLQLTTTYLNVKLTNFCFVELALKPHYTSYIEIFSSQEILSFSNRGPPTA